MTPSFPRIRQAIYFTIQYFEVGRIANCIAQLAGGRNLEYLDSYHEMTMTCHGQMEDEINQNIFGSNSYIKVAMFEHLKEWLEIDWRLNKGYEVTIENLVDSYNDKKWLEYQKQIEAEDEKFRNSGVYERGHDEVYEIERKNYFDILNRALLPARKETITNKWFYCNDKKPELIDKAYLPQYYKMIDGLVANFRRCSAVYVSRYDSGLYLSSLEIVYEKRILLEQKETKQLTDQEPQPIKKLKLNLSVPQLAYLFKLLYDLELISHTSKADLKRFIISNFSTYQAEEISDKSLENKLSTTEKAEADWWAVKFKEMHNLAKKV